MTSELHSTVTRLLEEIHQGNAAARERLGRLIYTELHRLAEYALEKERPGHTLQPTDLVQEIFVRLLDGDVLTKAPNRAYLFGAVSRALRQILVDHARKRAALKNGGGWQRTPLDEALDYYDSERIDLLELHEALETLRALHARQGQVFDEHHFGGFTFREIAEHLGVSEATACNDFKRAQLWLATQIGQEP
jgi:RNA polymerase sigma factor (TIGR02999 family)